MKKLGFIMVSTLLLMGAVFTDAMVAQPNQPTQQVKKATPTEVYYFHYSRRCTTCQTVEKVAQESLSSLYPEAVKSGDIVFKSVNLEEKANKDLVKKMKVQGQSLIIANGKEQVDIVDKAFMYAVSAPEKLKAEMKSHIEKYLK
jgi:hypothetical protein